MCFRVRQSDDALVQLYRSPSRHQPPRQDEGRGRGGAAHPQEKENKKVKNIPNMHFLLDIPQGEVSFPSLATHISFTHVVTNQDICANIVLSMSFINEYIQFCWTKTTVLLNELRILMSMMDSDVNQTSPDYWRLIEIFQTIPKTRKDHLQNYIF